MSTASPLAFTCPDCDQQLSADDETGSALLRSGCPYCNASVEPTDFSEQ